MHFYGRVLYIMRILRYFLGYIDLTQYLFFDLRLFTPLHNFARHHYQHIRQCFVGRTKCMQLQNYQNACMCIIFVHAYVLQWHFLTLNTKLGARHVQCDVYKTDSLHITPSTDVTNQTQTLPVVCTSSPPWEKGGKQKHAVASLIFHLTYTRAVISPYKSSVKCCVISGSA